jgi:hypothetical protein
MPKKPKKKPTKSQRPPTWKAIFRELEGLRQDITKPYRFNPKTRQYEPVRRAPRPAAQS